MSKNLNDYDIVVAIDFGTTYSGYYILEINNEIPYLEEYWGNDWKTKEAVSAMTYRSFTKTFYYWIRSFFYKNDVKVEDQDQDSLQYVSRVKILLDKAIKEDLPPLPPGWTLAKTIADYLQEMRRPIFKDILKRFPACADPSRYRYCMTVPTMWSDESKGIMREAAILAGFIKAQDEPGRLLIVDETLASALYCERTYPGLEFPDGSLCMICNAGGGTVDLATFEKDGSSGTHGIKEVTVGSGVTCGSSFLDIEFEAMLRERVSNYPSYTENYIQLSLAAFEQIFKDEFDGYGNSLADILHPGQTQNYIHTYPWIKNDDGFTTDEMRTRLFDPLVDQILGAMEKQFGQLEDQRQLDVLFITGGFANSPYLQHRIFETFKDRIKGFHIPEGIQLSAMRGGALFGIKPSSITQRILRRTYGIKLYSPTDEAWDNSWLEKDRFHVCIYKGEAVDDNKWITRKVVWNKEVLPIISLCAYDGSNESVPEYPRAKEVNLVTIFDTKARLDSREQVTNGVLVANICFGVDKIKVKVDLFGKEYEYVAGWDVIGEKSTQLYNIIEPSF
ncbi:hypothetical protein F4703DRAFT_1915998 [Phycomyces blakesleeanus]